jgi:hypothetical protein
VELSTFNWRAITVAKKIAKVDADAMNQLFAGEITRMTGRKQAAGDEKETTHTEVALADHDEYMEILNSILKESPESTSANDPLRD